MDTLGFTSTVSEDTAHDHIEQMIIDKASARGQRQHNSKKFYEDVDARLRKANRKNKSRRKNFSEDEDYSDEFYDE